MKPFGRAAICSSALVALVALFGCASTKVTESRDYQGERVARPDRIIVHDFAATPADIPAWSAAAGRHAAPSTPQTAEMIETGRELGAQVAKELVAEIRGMGLPAVSAAGQAAPRVGDIVIIGYFESIDEGSAIERVAIGFGSGGADLTTQVEGYLMTDQGMRELGSREIDAGAGGKTPGVVVPLAVTVATSNPIGLIVGSAVKVGGEVTDKSTIEAQPSGQPRKSVTSYGRRFKNRAGSELEPFTSAKRVFTVSGPTRSNRNRLHHGSISDTRCRELRSCLGDCDRRLTLLGPAAATGVALCAFTCERRESLGRLKRRTLVKHIHCNLETTKPIALSLVAMIAMVGVTLSLSGCASGGARGPAETPEVALVFEKYTLDNGLEVILHKDDRLPIVAVNLWYHVGPVNEAAGRTGFAHLFEHMMFQGSAHTEADSFFKHLENAGASMVNGTTDFDRTNYMEDVPSNQLELALWLESDRMGFLLEKIDQVMLSNQQDVVRNERRQSVENAPYGLPWEELYHLLFDQITPTTPP